MLSFLYVLILGAGILVIMSKNTVQSVLYLILVFLLCSLLFIYLGADFIGLIILIVYIGAIAVLFLFVVMMLNIRILENSFNFLIYMPIIILLSLIFVFQSIYFFFNIFSKEKSNNIISYFDWNFINNIQMNSIGELLFNKLYILFIGAAFLLFIAMIGAIVLTMEDDYIIIKEIKIESIRFFSKNIN
jgi:NADH-quinone oxidoreductase subunit J